LEQGNWYHLDNVAKVFLASHNKRDTRCMRISCTLKQEVDKDVLQEALLKTVESKKQFQVRIRRGLFWHYIEPTDEMPLVVEESTRPCPILYGKNYRGVLHYQVSYFHNRINLDMFHALTDGTGALEFLNIIVFNYLSIKYPGELSETVVHGGTDEYSSNQDSFKQFYEKTDSIKTGTSTTKKAYHIHSKKLPYEQLQFFEVHMSMKDVRAKSKEMKVSMTSYLGARLMMSLYNDMPTVARKLPITISMPVNLRNFFPSDTSRNFFNSVIVSHEFDGTETLESLAREYDEKLKDCLSEEKIKTQMQSYEKIENLLFTRLVPLAIKQPVVRFFAKKGSKTVSAVLSNMGNLKLPDEMMKHISEFSAFCSTEELFIVVASFGDDLTFGISSAYSGTGVIKNFIRGFRQEDIDVKVAATEVIR